MLIEDELLVADFSQCFEQMRHYETGFLKRIEFGFGGIVAVIGAVAVLLERFRASGFTLAVSGLLLCVSSIAGVLLVFSLARNRVYFTVVARYVNEIRALYLSKHPGGVTNKSGIYSDYHSPRVFSPGSSQSIDIYFLALCVSTLISGATVSFDLARKSQTGEGFGIPWAAAIIVLIASTAIQILCVIFYWQAKEKGKSRHRPNRGSHEA